MAAGPRLTWHSFLQRNRGRPRVCALRRIAGFFRPGVRGVSALAAGLRCERAIARKAALGEIDTLSALSPSLSRQSPILRKTVLFVRDACAALPRNRKLFFSVHGGKALG